MWQTAKAGRHHIDHKKPLALGGSNSIRNLQALCPECHHVKTKYDRKKIAEARKKRESSFSFDIDIEPSEIPDLFGSSSGKSKGKKKKRKGEEQEEKER